MSKFERFSIAIDQYFTYNPDGKKLAIFGMGMLAGIEVFGLIFF